MEREGTARPDPVISKQTWKCRPQSRWVGSAAGPVSLLLLWEHRRDLRSSEAHVVSHPAGMRGVSPHAHAPLPHTSVCLPESPSRQHESPTRLRFASLRIYYTLSPAEQPGKEKNRSVNRTRLVLTNGILNQEAPRMAKISKSLKKGLRLKETLFHGHVWLTWCWWI